MKYYFKQYTLPANVYIKVYYNIITNSIHLQWHCNIYIYILSWQCTASARLIRRVISQQDGSARFAIWERGAI